MLAIAMKTRIRYIYKRTKRVELLTDRLITNISQWEGAKT